MKILATNNGNFFVKNENLFGVFSKEGLLLRESNADEFAWAEGVMNEINFDFSSLSERLVSKKENIEKDIFFFIERTSFEKTSILTIKKGKEVIKYADGIQTILEDREFKESDLPESGKWKWIHSTSNGKGWSNDICLFHTNGVPKTFFLGSDAFIYYGGESLKCVYDNTFING